MKPVIALFKNRHLQVYEVAPTTSVFEALQCLATHGVGALAVMVQGRLVGVVSERDYTRKVALQGRNSRDTLVADIMTREVITVSADTGTHACMSLMSQHKIRHLPVMEGERLLGMLSIRDLMDDIIAEHEQTISQLTHYISG